MSLSVQHLHKSFQSLQVLSDFNLEIEAGQVVGCLGRNGAGKSTLIKILMGMEKPDQGSVAVLGLDPVRETVRLRQRIGYVAQEQRFYPWMTVTDLGTFMQGFFPAWDTRYYSELLENLVLPLDRAVGDFSGGMKAKTALALALAHRPELVLLDEPAAGMDPLARREFLDLVHRCSAETGMTALFSTHLVEDVQSIADQICIVEGGSNFYQGAIDPLLESVFALQAAGPDVDGLALPEFLLLRPDLILKDSQAGQRRQLIIKSENSSIPYRDYLSNNADADPTPWKMISPSFEEVLVALLQRR